MSSNVVIKGDDQRLRKYLDKLQQVDTSEINSVLAEQMRSTVELRFRQSKDPEGNKWQPSKRVREEGGQTLVRTSMLKNSIQSKSAPEGFAVGTNLKYAATHQKGAKDRLIKPKKKKVLRFPINGTFRTAKEVHVDIPARPFLGFSEQDLLDIQETIESYYKE